MASGQPVTVSPSGQVNIVNNDSVEHSVTSDTSGAFSQDIEANEKGSSPTVAARRIPVPLQVVTRTCMAAVDRQVTRLGGVHHGHPRAMAKASPACCSTSTALWWTPTICTSMRGVVRSAKSAPRLVVADSSLHRHGRHTAVGIPDSRRRAGCAAAGEGSASAVFHGVGAAVEMPARARELLERMSARSVCKSCWRYRRAKTNCRCCVRYWTAMTSSLP